MFQKKDRSAATTPTPTPTPTPVAQLVAPLVADPGSTGWFKGFGDVKPGAGGNYFNPGGYVVKVIALTRQVSENPDTLGNQIFIAEFEIVEVTAAFEADPGPPGSAGWGASNKRGEQCTSVQNTTKHHKMALGNIKNLLYAIARNETPDLLLTDISPDEWQAALIEATNPPGTKYAGHLLRLTASKKITKRTKQPFTALNFGPYQGPAPTDADPSGEAA